MLSTTPMRCAVSAARTTAFDFAALRQREFARLDAQLHSYLDYTGSALYGASQLRAHLQLLESGLFGNPHSESTSSRASTGIIEQARSAVLSFLDVDAASHVVCFTANSSAAIKLVAESYPFSARTGLLLSADNHNSINGIREYARAAQAPVRILPLDTELRLEHPEQHLKMAENHATGLLALPAQSNFSGVRHPLKLVQFAKDLGYDVLLDVAAYVPSQALSLKRCPADFAVLSFYKLFGYPTGLGALVMRRDALKKLRRPWFAGGTVRYASVHANVPRLHAGAEGFEDGTPDFLGLAALPSGFALLQEVGMENLSAHVAGLSAELLAGLTKLRHPNGSPRIRLYGPSNMQARGGTFAFNVLDRHGQALPYTQVEAAAREAGISLRGGCFCNPGASEAAFGIEPITLAACLSELGERFSAQGLAACAGSEVGALRVSLGLANNRADVQRLLALLSAI